MKLVMAIVHNDDAGGVVDALLREEYRATRLNSSGGFLRRSNATLLIGVEESAVDDVIRIIRASTKSRSEAPAHGTPSAATRRVDLRAAVVFVIGLEAVIRV
jgi:uncharacterized protein YaaQ